MNKPFLPGPRPDPRPARRPAGVEVRLAGLGTALPPHSMPQDLVVEKARALLAPRFPQFDKLEPSFRNAGVSCRHSVVPLDWFETEHDWPERNAAYLEGGTALFEQAAAAALDQAGIEAGAVDTVVTVSSTGIATPTLEARAARSLGFRPDLRRVPLFGLGCAGGVTGLATARALAAADPGSTVLLVAVEACTLSFRMDRLSKADIIATVLFGDGAAAAVLRAGKGTDGATGPVLGRGCEHTWPDTLEIMGWEVNDTGLGVIFDRSIPDFATARFRDAADAALAARGLSVERIDRFVCHPGGARVLVALEAALDLASGSLDHERAVLERAGNMSAPTALFVLADALAAGVQGQLMLCALGPGFTASFLPIRA